MNDYGVVRALGAMRERAAARASVLPDPVNPMRQIVCCECLDEHPERGRSW
jgi:hypothetical protein